MARRRRWLILFAVALVVAGGGRLVSLQGWIAPVRIGGDSMAPSLLGGHYQLDCRDCGFPFVCGMQHPPPDQVAICPNCGHEIALSASLLRGGQRVLIDRLAFSLRTPRRYDLVAVRDPLNDGALAAKRVVGLPGEQITIRDGELLIDGQLDQKTLPQMRKFAISVHNDRHRPQRTGTLATRWAGERDSTAWEVSAVGFRIDLAPDEHPRTSDWLTYVNQSFYQGPGAGHVAPIVDNDSFNQGFSRQLDEVRDVGLRCRMTFSDNVHLALLARDGRDDFRAVIRSGRRVRLLCGNRLLAESGFSIKTQDRPVWVEYTIFDQQVVLSLDGREVVRTTYQDRDVPFEPSARPLAIGVRWGNIRVTDLEVRRDIYWQPPYEQQVRWEAPPLGPGEFLLLGDNAPVSIDSRHWPKAGVHGDSILGRVVEF